MVELQKQTRCPHTLLLLTQTACCCHGNCDATIPSCVVDVKGSVAHGEKGGSAFPLSGLVGSWRWGGGVCLRVGKTWKSGPRIGQPNVPFTVLAIALTLTLAIVSLPSFSSFPCPPKSSPVLESELGEPGGKVVVVIRYRLPRGWGYNPP